MHDTKAWECPNCGGTALIELALDERRCEYCGTVLTRPKTAPERPRCPSCGFATETGARYCNQCGLAIAKWTAKEKPKTDLAIISIAATVVGSFFVPVGGAILGLILAYKARDQARATGGKSGRGDLARTAIVVGWVGLGVTLLPMCMFPAIFGSQMGLSLCSGMLELPMTLAGG